MKVVVFSGTVYGAAEDVARHAVARLEAAGHQCVYFRRTDLAPLLDAQPQALLGITSTTGLGELPDDLIPLYSELRASLPAALRGLPGGVIGLGDSSYDDSFCGGGELLRELFDELGIEQVQPMLRLDACETVTPETDAEPWVDALAEQLKRRG
ncbi:MULTISPECIES: flavodoxin [unclassified Pseudomonas]|uniref:flavodoxin n=1 Tax=unclassified Pseudomonas TaxID=196821 RepID=UPI000BD146BE|nr:MULTISPECIES: flavodoxin [unclassified Pseudomonas]PVZ15998.1 flavodoxin [Pseudomonas sp. URIL14HWK12:I12]PVZ26146.1 flavodoxin [Pseudomonas sp. URIL14HWK12:I10]PVZ36330.1 flavodoxin [Pseudomonas sp. URIL14HWK12:I11]SNZ18392.1 MioC protein [Pseudomonas sp. URIL14HWK12:I9]